MNLAEALKSVTRSDIVNGEFSIMCESGICRKSRARCDRYTLKNASEVLDKLRELGLLDELKQLLGERVGSGKLCNVLTAEPLLSFRYCDHSIADLCRNAFRVWLEVLRTRVEFFEKLREEIVKHQKLFESAFKLWFNHTIIHSDNYIDFVDLFGNTTFVAGLRMYDIPIMDKIEISVKLDEKSEKVKDVLIDFINYSNEELPRHVYNVVRNFVEVEAAEAGLKTNVSENHRFASGNRRFIRIRVSGGKDGVEPAAAINIAVNVLTAATTATLLDDIAWQLATTELAGKTRARVRV